AGVKLDASLRTLGETFARGAEGDFRTPYQATGEQGFGSLMRLLQETLARINQSFAALAQAVDDGRRVPAHERAPGLSQAQSRLAWTALPVRARERSARGGSNAARQGARAAVRLHSCRRADALVPARLRPQTPDSVARHFAAAGAWSADRAVHADRGDWPAVL